MIPQTGRSFPALHRAFGGPVHAVRSSGRDVRVSPSRAELRRAEPSLSFQAVAPGSASFDIIVATDPTLFDPANAHRRTPKNFRTSRQDFQGEPVEIETGFYLLPRAFVRDLVSSDPRPTRLHYVAVAYSDAAGTADPVYSVPPEDLSARAPHVTISGDLVAANLAKVLGMAVDRLGAVNAAGRVMTVQPSACSLPDAIGGLPIIRRTQPPSPAAAGHAPFRPAADHPPAPPPVPSGPVGQPAESVRSTPPPPPAASGSEAAQPGAFLDEDYAYSGADPAGTGFRDLDAWSSPATAFSYDDGFGEGDSPAAPSARDEPIPPLDPGPGAVPAAPHPSASPAEPPAEPPVFPPVAPADEDLLLQAVIAEGAGGRYDAMSLDGGFRGRFGPDDPYYQRAHDGLRLGPHQAMQDSGELGELLLLMRSADEQGFSQVFGPEAEALLAVVTAAGPSGLEIPGGRGPRVQPVAGHDLWEEPWVERFRAAARQAPFQAAMRGQILARRLDPLRRAAEALGLQGDRGLAMVLALAIHRGVAGAEAHLRAASNPFDTPARMAAALDSLGFSDLPSFRIAAGLPPGDVVDAATHFALFAALRALGSSGQVQVPDAEGVLDSIVTMAGPGKLGDALLRLRVSTTFGDPEG